MAQPDYGVLRWQRCPGNDAMSDEFVGARVKVQFLNYGLILPRTIQCSMTIMLPGIFIKLELCKR